MEVRTSAGDRILFNLFFGKGDEMKNYVIGFLLGLCVVFLLGAARMKYVDGHCQASLSDIGIHGEVYLAITNTIDGRTIVRKISEDDFGYNGQVVFDPASINANMPVVDDRDW